MTDTPAERGAESTWTRLRRRKVVQWGVVYVAAAWGFLQGLEYLSGTYDWPRQIQQLATLALLIGLPVVLVLAWYHGDRGQQRISTPELAILTLLLLLGGGAFWYYQRANETPTAASTTAQAAAPAALPLEVAAAPHEKSIAVLPFADMSAAKDQEYMSDGIAEELLNLLARVPDLKVIARTSSFAFKGEKIEIDEIAEKLNVAHILEGSVRTSGNKLRITAQLIRTADSTHLWSETYDRTLDDTFAVQDDIAAKVVEALKATLLGGEISTSAEPQDVEAYTYFLQGRHFAQRQSQEDCERALRYLQQSIDRNPAYAPAWVELANVQLTQADRGWITSTSSADGYARARDSVERALALDPKLASAHSAMGYVQAGFWNWAAAEESNRTAVALEPGNADVLLQAGVVKADLGRSDESLALIRKSIERDPLQLDAYEWLAYVLNAVGRHAEAEITRRKVLELDPNRTGGHVWLGKSLLLQGKADEALRAVERESDERRRLTGLSLVYHTLGRKADADSALALMKKKYADDRAFNIAEAHAWRGESDFAFDWLDRTYALRDPGLADIKLSPYLQRLAGDPRHKAFLRKMKLPESPLTARVQ